MRRSTVEQERVIGETRGDGCRRARMDVLRRCKEVRAAAWVVVLCALGFALLTLVFSVFESRSRLAGSELSPVDLWVYRAGGDAVSDHVDLYTMRTPGTGLRFTYPPFAAIVFTVLVPLKAGLAQLLITVMSLTALARACWLVGRAAARGRLPTYGLVAVASLLWILALQFEPTRETLRLGQVNLVLMWMVLEDLIGDVRPEFRGLLVGLAAGFKLTPALFLAFLLVTGRSRSAARAATAFVTTVLVGFVVVPWSSWQYWTHDAYVVSRLGGVAYAGNQSLYGAFARIWGVGSEHLAWLLTAATVAITGLAAARDLSRSGRELMAVSTVALTGLVTSPVSWTHHWVWILPLVGAVAAETFQPRPMKRWVPWAAAGLAAVLVWVFTSREIWGLPEEQGREHSWHGLQLLQGNAYLLTALVFIASTLWLTRQERWRAWLRRGTSPMNPPRDAGSAIRT